MIGEIVVPFGAVDEHTVGVADVKVTVRPDEADAATMSVGSTRVRSLSGRNVIVWGVVPSAAPADQWASGATTVAATSAHAKSAERRRMLDSPHGIARTVHGPSRAIAASRREEPGHPRRRVSSGSRRAALIDGNRPAATETTSARAIQIGIRR